MIGKLSATEIEDLLKSEIVGRIGCYHAGTTYIVPISYAYDGTYIYAHSHEGMKVDIMRNNPSICFQVDHLHDMANWKSVIAWGKYEELPAGETRSKAIQTLLNRQLPIVSSITTHLGATWPFPSENVNDLEGIIFRVALHDKTGRFESTSYSH